MAIVGLHHHSFAVLDVDRSLKFYRDVLGLEQIQDAERAGLPAYDKILGFRDTKIRVALLQDKDKRFIIELIQWRNPAGQKRDMSLFHAGASHVAFEIDDMAAEYKRMRKAGVKFISSPVDIIRDGRLIAKCCFALDPDGIAVEMYELCGK